MRNMKILNSLFKPTEASQGFILILSKTIPNVDWLILGAKINHGFIVNSWEYGINLKKKNPYFRMYTAIKCLFFSRYYKCKEIYFRGVRIFLYCSVLSLGGNVNTRRMSNPDIGSIFHIKIEIISTLLIKSIVHYHIKLIERP